MSVYVARRDLKPHVHLSYVQLTKKISDINLTHLFKDLLDKTGTNLYFLQVSLFFHYTSLQRVADCNWTLPPTRGDQTNGH